MFKYDFIFSERYFDTIDISPRVESTLIQEDFNDKVSDELSNELKEKLCIPLEFD
jgi:hypothetical protein